MGAKLSDRSKYLLLFGFQAFVVAAVLLGLELAARWSVSRIPPAVVPSGVTHPPYYNNPGVLTSPKAFNYHLKYRINSLGLRGPETTLEKPKGRRRLLLVGDSVVFGAMVQDDETLSVQLQERLGEGWEVLNGGVGGYDVWDYEAFLENKGFAFGPDVVVVGLYLNDHITHDAYKETVDKRSAANRPLMAAVRDALFHSELVNTLLYRLQGRQSAKHPRFAVSKPLKPADEAAFAAAFPGDPQTIEAVKGFLEDYRYDPNFVKDTLRWMLDLEAWEKVREPLKRMRDACAKRKVRFLVVVFPVQFELYPRYRWPEPHRALAAMLRALAVPSLDLLPALAAGGRGDEYYGMRYDYAHPDARAYGLAADELRKELVRLRWLE